MKYVARIVIGIVGVVGLCSCESLPTTGMFDRASTISPSMQAYGHSYHAFHSEVGQGQSELSKINDVYSYSY